MEHFISLIIEPLREATLNFIRFLPNLLAMLTIVISGVFGAWLAKKALLRLFKAVKFDSWSDRMGITALMRKGDLWTKPSDTVVAIVYWIFLIAALMVGLSALKIDAMDKLVSRFFLYLPRVFSAVLILVFGYIIAGFLSRTALIAGVNRGYHYAKILAEAIRLLVIVLILAMALEQLQVAPGIVIAAFSIAFGGIVIALAISFGVGGIDAARRMIEKEQEKKEEKKDIEHI